MTRIKVLLSMIALQGLIALPFLLQIRSMQRNSWLFGFSLSRLVVFLLFGLLILFILSLSLRFFIHSKWSRVVSDRLHTFLSEMKHLWPAMYCSILFVVAGLALLIIFNVGPIGLRAGFFGVIFLRVQPVVAWLTLSLLEVVIFLLVLIPSLKLEETTWPYWLSIGAFAAAGLAAFTYWISLYLDLGWWERINNWYWVHLEKGGIHSLRFLGLLALALLVFSWVYLSRLSPRLRIIVLMLFGYMLMIGIGAVEGDNGFEALRGKLLFLNNQAVYSNVVSEEHVDPATLVSNYEHYAYYTMFLGAKPPGTLLLYAVIQKASEFIFHPTDTFDARLLRVTQVIVVLWPLLTVLTIPLLYRLARQFLDERDAFIPCILYLTAPNVLLMPLGLDKAFYPSLFLIGIYLILRSAQLRTFSSGLLLGLYLYLGLFFSFSLLPLLLWAPLWLLADGFDQNRKMLFPRLIRPSLGVGIGFLAIALAFVILLDYNVLVRYQGAMEWHRYANNFDLTGGFLLNAMVVNNLELATWTSFPMIIIAGVQIVTSLVFVIRRRATPADAFLVVFLFVYLCLNMFGQMHGEVGRVWLFLVTIFSLAAGLFISRVRLIRVPALLILVVLQILTTYFLLAYQCPCITG